MAVTNWKGLEYRNCSTHKAESLSIPTQVLEASRNTTVSGLLPSLESPKVGSNIREGMSH